VRVSLRFDSPHAGEVPASLREGLKSQVTYQLRLYRRQKGLLSFLGDRLLLERKLTRTASLDLFDNRYCLLDETGQRRFAGEAAFLEDLFSLRDFPLGPLAAGERAECYVLARGRLEPVRVVPPLDIVRLIAPLTSFSSRWVQAAIATRPLPLTP
jgi:hypothetical protein